MDEKEEMTMTNPPVFQLTDSLVYTLDLGIDALREKRKKEYEEGLLSLAQWVIEQEELDTCKAFLADLMKAGEQQTGETFPANRG